MKLYSSARTPPGARQHPAYPSLIGDEARNNAVNSGAVFLKLAESNRVAIPLLAGSYRTDVVTGSR